MRSAFSAGKDRGSLRLDGNHSYLGFAFFEHFANAGDGAASADASNEDIDHAIRIAPNLLGGGAAVNFRICRVAELVRDKIAVVFGCQFFSLLNSTSHPLLLWRKNHFSAVCF